MDSCMRGWVDEYSPLYMNTEVFMGNAWSPQVPKTSLEVARPHPSSRAVLTEASPCSLPGIWASSLLNLTSPTPHSSYMKGRQCHLVSLNRGREGPCPPGRLVIQNPHGIALQGMSVRHLVLGESEPYGSCFLHGSMLLGLLRVTLPLPV